MDLWQKCHNPDVNWMWIVDVSINKNAHGEASKPVLRLPVIHNVISVLIHINIVDSDPILDCTLFWCYIEWRVSFDVKFGRKLIWSIKINPIWSMSCNFHYFRPHIARCRINIKVISIIKTRRFHDCLICKIEILIPGKLLYNEAGFTGCFDIKAAVLSL